MRFQRVIEVNLFAHHRLGLDYTLHVVRLRDLTDNPIGLGGIGGPMHMTTDGFHRISELRQVVIEMAQRLGANRPRLIARTAPSSGSEVNAAARSVVKRFVARSNAPRACVSCRASSTRS